MDVAGTGLDAPTLSKALQAKGINIGSFGPTILRAVTHLDISAAQIEEAGTIFSETVSELRESS